ncbi:tripartite tricarboxylate transporter substrate binding protein [Ancylobacter polymorphus]|uniref:Tripartite tricarboxylate transporter substrate binding protein n=1 Tax=Ancylobacter polymorphus TaxID=223390 RepID=A0A9E7A098_9HYPH|nr:tripartite tricarboxylate transporter substrate binding protein [Ancylobacter polymorphus]UOK73542.1 tripartite tricarboxylate transporter substrate binding protein [Ancylobacter polymorphus]
MHSSARAGIPALSRRHAMKAALAAAALFSGLGSAVAENYPAKNFQYIVQTGVGGGSDILARTLAKILHEEKLIPTNVLVENRPGGSGAIAYSYIAGQKASPYVLGGVGVSFFTTPLLGKMPVNYKDFTPLAAIARSPYILAVRADSPIKSVADIKTKSGLTTGTSGAVSDPALLATMTAQQLGTQIRAVPYDGEGEVLAALLGGHIDLIYGNPNEILEQIKAGALRPLAVSSPDRLTSLPDVPTFKEQGYDIVHTQLRGIIMPKDVPPEAVAYWEGVLKKVAEGDAWKTQYIQRFNEEPIFLNSAEFAKQMDVTSARYEKLMKELKLIK